MKDNPFFSTHKPIIGMVHLLALPETPDFAGDLVAIYERAKADTQALIGAGIDGIIVENFGDEPYVVGEPPPAQLATMAGITAMIREMTTIPIGVNVQFNAWQAEIALAYACQAEFVRVEVFIDTVISAQGMIMPCSAQITRYRQALSATHIQLRADIQTKYTHNIIAQSITQSAIDTQNAGADVVIVTGTATGQATPLDAVREVKTVVDLPVVVGSGTTLSNVNQVLDIADGAIVGSSLKVGGTAANPVSLEHAKSFMEVAQRARQA